MKGYLVGTLVAVAAMTLSSCETAKPVQPESSDELQKAKASPVIAVDAAIVMFVADVNATWSLAGGWMRLGSAQVRIVDEAGNVVSGATVTGSFSGCFSYTNQSAVTGPFTYPDGSTAVAANFVGKKVSAKNNKCFITFTVTGVSKAGYVYDPTRNVKTSDSEAVCPLCQ